MYLKIKQHKETKERSVSHFVFKELYVLLHQNRLLMSTLLYNSFQLSCILKCQDFKHL